MELKGLSATGIRDFLQCTLKVVFRYDSELKSIKNDHAKIGIAVHEALEQFTRRMANKKSFPDSSDYDFATSTFMNTAVENGLENMGFYSDGKIMVTEFIDRYDPAEEIIAIEHFFRETTSDGVPIVGAIDKVVKINDDTIGIVDYKTSRTALTNWQLRDDIQLSMYDLAASIIWPEFKNRLLFLDYVRIDKRVSTYRTDEERETFREFLSSMWTQMNKLNEDEAVGSINNLCGWCDYKAYCPAYKQLLTKDTLKLIPLSEMTDGQFLDHWCEVADKKSVLEARQRELKMLVSEKFIQGEGVSDGSRELYSTQAARTNYDILDVARIISENDLFEVLNVNKAKLDRYVKDHPEVKNDLGKVASVNYNAPVYKVRAAKKEDIDADAKQNESAA